MNEDVMVLQNELGADGRWKVHMMASSVMDEAAVQEMVPEGVKVRLYQDELRFQHLEASWRPRGDLIVFERKFACNPDCPICRGKGCKWQRMVALWMLDSGERISQAVKDAAVEYATRTGFDPLYAWVRNLPQGVESGQEIRVGGEAVINLYAAYWMPERAVAVGRGNNSPLPGRGNNSPLPGRGNVEER